jgi:hypothetical protein
LKFVAFEVALDGKFLDVPDAAMIVRAMGLEFVDYNRVPTLLSALDAERDRESVQAIRNGMGHGKQRVGVVLRPITESVDHRGNRVICKHKQDKFRETATPRQVSQEELTVLADATQIAKEWVTEHRLEHILGKMVEPNITQMSEIIAATVEDIKREGASEIIWSPVVEKTVKREAAMVAKKLLTSF